MSVRLHPDGPDGPDGGGLGPGTTIDMADVLSGEPAERQALWLDRPDGVAAGVWACGTYSERLRGYPVDELCTVIEGRVTITGEDGRAETYGPGESFLMRKGFRGIWAVEGPFRKYFMVVP